MNGNDKRFKRSNKRGAQRPRIRQKQFPDAKHKKCRKPCRDRLQERKRRETVRNIQRKKSQQRRIQRHKFCCRKRKSMSLYQISSQTCIVFRIRPNKAIFSKQKKHTEYQQNFYTYHRYKKNSFSFHVIDYYPDALLVRKMFYDGLYYTDLSAIKNIFLTSNAKTCCL